MKKNDNEMKTEASEGVPFGSPLDKKDNEKQSSGKTGVDMKKKKKKKSKSSKKTSRRSEGNHKIGEIGDDKDRIRGQKLQYIQEQSSHHQEEPFMIGGVPRTSPIPVSSDNRNVNHNNTQDRQNDQAAGSNFSSQPGAFRVFLRGQRRPSQQESAREGPATARRPSASSSFFRRQPPLAHVERIEEPGRDQDDDDHSKEGGDQYNDEMERMEANRRRHKQQRRKGKNIEEEDSNFWVMGAIAIGVVLVASVLIATLIVVRGKGDATNLNTAPTEAPSSNIFEPGAENNALRELWDEYSNLFLFAVQFGFDRSACETAASPRVTMTCGVNGNDNIIAIVAAKYLDAQGREVEDTSYYSCENLAQQQDKLDCRGTLGDFVKGPTIAWIVGCATNGERSGLQVEAVYDLGAQSSGGGGSSSAADGAICNSNQQQSHVSHSMSMGPFCFEGEDYTFEPSVDCIKGSAGLVEASVKKKTVPFCGQSNSCDNTNGDDCFIDLVGPLDMKTSFPDSCGITKKSNQSFLDFFARSGLWGATSNNFQVREFGPNTHAVLTNP